MATTEPATQPDSEELERYAGRHVVPVLVLEISDERSRSRWREAVLISIIFHILLVHDVIPRIPFLLKSPIRAGTCSVPCFTVSLMYC